MLKWIDIGKVELLPQNTKDHDAGAIIESIKRFGFIDPIGLNTETNRAFDGNGRLEALRVMKVQGMECPKGVRAEGGKWLAPFFCFQIPEKEEQAAAIALNKTNELGGWDYDALAKVLSNLATLPDGLKGTGWDTDDLDAILAFTAMGGDDVAVPELEGWEEPLTAYRLIVGCDNEEQLIQLRGALGLDTENTHRVTFRFTDTNVAEA